MNKNTDNSLKNVHAGHRKRVRERFLQTGFYGFDEHQIMEMLLFYCVQRRDTNILAHELIDRFGSLSEVINADVKALEEFGLSENAIVLFRILPAAMKLYYKKSYLGVIYDSQEELAELFLSQFSEQRFEIRIACLRNDMSLAAERLLYAGERYTADTDKMSAYEYDDYIARDEFDGFPLDNVNFRDIVDAIVNCGSSLAVVAHNHLYNHPIPNQNEIKMIKKLKNFLKVFEITLVDYIIVAEGIYVALRGNDIYDVYKYDGEEKTRKHLDFKLYGSEK